MKLDSYRSEQSGGQLFSNTASRIRRMLRVDETKKQETSLDRAYSSFYNRNAIYECGVKDGLGTNCLDLSDILYAINRQGLGLASIIQESNSHIILRVQKCHECQKLSPGSGCSFTAGFIAGALRALGKPPTVSVHEVTCGEGNGCSCVFMASW